MQLELTPEERDLLKRVIDQAAKEMKVEVRRTSTRDYHDELQKEEVMLFDLVKRLGEAG
jgi:ribosome recycling factor